ncbi:hypothetical protein MUK42_09098 [Musa troglodytarum]|uniref:Uncharacterized protein n=1 Tax=Musa troglodytarum TaxID=320322 RepID=A0A9E7EAQ2_9LILI|nr:hypothetical protein MUK42_09098 [Musa troglodytarum]
MAPPTTPCRRLRPFHPIRSHTKQPVPESSGLERCRTMPSCTMPLYTSQSRRTNRESNRDTGASTNETGQSVTIQIGFDVGEVHHLEIGGKPMNEFVAARSLFPLLLLSAQRFPFTDSVFDLVHAINALDEGGAPSLVQASRTEALEFFIERRKKGLAEEEEAYQRWRR